MFASKTPRDLNHDLTPWHCPGADEQYRIADGAQLECDTFSPRPEFDHVQHNMVNRILTYVRERRAEAESYRLILWRIDNGGTSGTDLEWSHARRVVKRLVKFEVSK